MWGLSKKYFKYVKNQLRGLGNQLYAPYCAWVNKYFSQSLFWDTIKCGCVLCDFYISNSQTWRLVNMHKVLPDIWCLKRSWGMFQWEKHGEDFGTASFNLFQNLLEEIHVWEALVSRAYNNIPCVCWQHSRREFTVNRIWCFHRHWFLIF